MFGLGGVGTKWTSYSGRHPCSCKNGHGGMDMWSLSYVLLSTALVMLSVVDLEPLQAYKKLIAGYQKDDGQMWLAALSEHERAPKDNKFSDIKPNRP